MKKGTLHFLGRKNPSLFDTNRPIQIQDMENGLSDHLGQVLDSSAIPETGTASVRSKPTVKYHTSSESVHGFNVPTPTVPLFSVFNGVTGGHSDGDGLSNGSAISVSSVEGELFVPPPPSVAPPPPPTQFILPPPDFMGDLDSPTKAMFMRPTMTPPNPPSQPPALEEDFTLLKPPPMSPPKPPSTYTSALPSISAQPSSMIPELPKFAPPKPPSEYQPKSGKTPPPKPNRLSSIAGVEGFIQPTSPAATSQMSTPSSFNPQNTAKLYNSPKTSILSGHGDSDTRPKQILLIQDSCPVPVQLNGNPSPAPPSKPIRGTAPGTQLDLPKVNLQANMPSKTPQLQPKSQDKTVISMLQENNHAPSLPQVASKFIKAPLTPVSSLDNAMFAKSPSQKCKFSPLIDRKLRNLKGPETSRDGSPASPLALLQAAKERDKYRSSVLLENGPQSSANIHHSDSTPNSFVVIPKSTSISPTTSKKGLEEDSKSTVPSLGPMATTQTQALRNAPPSVRSPLAPTTPALSGTSRAATSPSFGDPSLKQNIKQSTPSFDTKREANQPEVNMALLPPPPAFANFDFGASVDSPPDFPPPDPPAKKAPSPTAKPVNSAPAPPPKPNATARPAPVQDVKPQVTYQIFPKVPIAKPLPAVSESQATLLSILQKKMLEMENTMIPKKDTESSSDEWGSPLPEDETRFPFAPRTTPPRLPAKTPSLDMRELETKVAKKQQVNSSVTSNGTQSKQHGMTFTVRPGTRQPITLVSKGEPS